MRFLLCCLLVSMSSVYGQESILPFTGFKSTAVGIEPKDLEIQLNGNTWTSNRLPANADFDIRLIEPNGFEVKDSLYKPGIEVFIGTKNRDTLGYAANIYGEGFPGYDMWMFKRLSVTLGFGPEVVPGDSLFIKARFFDQNGPASFTVEGLVVIADSTAAPDVAEMTNYVHSFKGYDAASVGAEIKDMRATIKEIERSTLEINWFTQKAFAFDLRSAETTVWCYFYDGSVRQMKQFQDYNLMFDAEAGKEPTDVKTSIQLYTDVFELMQVQFIRVRTTSPSKGIVIDGVISMKKFW